MTFAPGPQPDLDRKLALDANVWVAAFDVSDRFHDSSVAVFAEAASCMPAWRRYARRARVRANASSTVAGGREQRNSACRLFQSRLRT